MCIYPVTFYIYDHQRIANVLQYIPPRVYLHKNNTYFLYLKHYFAKIFQKLWALFEDLLYYKKFLSFPTSMCPIVSFFLVWIHKINLLVRCPMYIVFVSIAGEKPLDTYLSEKYPGVTLSEDAMDKIKKTKASDTYFCFTQKQMDSWFQNKPYFCLYILIIWLEKFYQFVKCYKTFCNF